MATTHSPSNGSHTPPDALKNSVDTSSSFTPLHSFDPAASPEEKAAIAGQMRDKLESIIPNTNANEQDNGREITIQAPEPGPVPVITVEDTDVEKKEAPEPENSTETAEHVKEDVEDHVSALPGAIPKVPVPAIPEWYRVGWREVSGIDDHIDAQTREKAVIDTFLSEQFYGSWYHNAGVIVFAVLTSHFLTRFNFGWGWLFILLAICNTYYTTSLQRVRWHARDEIQRELVKTRLVSEHESADWLNNFLDRFWLIYEPVLSASIVASVDQVLSTNCPAFLDSLRLSHFTLGTKAPRIDKVRTFPTTADDVVIMDWALSFTPNDLSEMKKVPTKQNPKIILDVHIGKSFATASLPILVENITFAGLVRIRMKLMTNFPHVQILDFTFLEKPKIDYVLKPIGGETFGFDIANIPGLATFIMDMTHATLGPMMYDPNVFTLNLEQMLSGKPLDAAIGIIQVKVYSARRIMGNKIGGGTPDPYITLTFNNRTELARTTVKTNTFNPTWAETKYLLVHSLEESLCLHLWDYNEHRKDTSLGIASFELPKLKEDSVREDVRSSLLLDGKDKGEVRYDVTYYPVLDPQETEAVDGSVGLVRLVVHQAKELDHSFSIGDINPMAKVYIGNSKHPAYVTRRMKRTLNPVWESAYEFICRDKASCVVKVAIVDDRDILKDPVIGYMSIRLLDLFDCTGEAGRDWFPLSNCKSGKVRVSAEWKPLNMPGNIGASDQYAPPIGVVRLLLDRATDVKNVEAALGGKSDPYVRVQINNVIKARTEVINNNLNPVWDEIVYIPVHSLKDTLFLECMDYQHLTRDRSLGSVELQVSDLATVSEDDTRYPYKSTGAKHKSDPIRLDKGTFHGELHYTATFIPALGLKGIKFEVDHPHELVRSDTGSVHSITEDFSSTEVTIKRQSIKSIKNTKSEELTSPTGEKAETDKAPQANDAEKGIEMNTEELLEQQSGIIIFNVISGSLAKKARLEVALDDGYWPVFSTVRARSTSATWEHVGEGFIKEIDFSRVWLRLNEADEGEKDDIIAQWKGDAKAFLQATLAGPQEFTLADENERNESRIKIETRYVPVPVALEARETVSNQGILRVDLLDGRDILAADRGGKSDPYAVFTLNGLKVFKSQTIKKTLNPDWNENFTVTVPSRVHADFSVEVFDWNQIEQSKSLGSARIDLNDIEPLSATERTLHLGLPQHGLKGQVRVGLVFQPEIIAKTRKATSTFTAGASATFSTAGRAVTQIGALPMYAGKGVIHGVTGVFKHHQREQSSAHSPSPSPPPQLARSSELVPVVDTRDKLETGSTSFPSVSMITKQSIDGGQRNPGSLRVSVLEARNLPTGESKAYVVVRVGDREQRTKHTNKTATPDWHGESFVFAAGPLMPKLFVWLFEHKTIGKDREIADGEVELWSHLKMEGTSNAEVAIDLRQGGTVNLRLEFDADVNPLGHSGIHGSMDALHRMSRTVSLSGSPSRFSLARARRTMDGRDEE